MEFDYQKLLKQAIEKIPRKESTGKRFKIPEVVCEIQGNKTLIKNFIEISTILRRDPKHLSKYLLKEMATPGNIQGAMLILNTKITRENLQKKLEDYIREFVYCKVCGEPDTKLNKEGRIVFIVCEACGAKYPIRSI